MANLSILFIFTYSIFFPLDFADMIKKLCSSCILQESLLAFHGKLKDTEKITFHFEIGILGIQPSEG